MSLNMVENGLRGGGGTSKGLAHTWSCFDLYPWAVIWRKDTVYIYLRIRTDWQDISALVGSPGHASCVSTGAVRSCKNSKKKKKEKKKPTLQMSAKWLWYREGLSANYLYKSFPHHMFLLAQWYMWERENYCLCTSLQQALSCMNVLIITSLCLFIPFPGSFSDLQHASTPAAITAAMTKE